VLAEHPIDVMLLVTDLGAAKVFYSEKVGLRILIETNDFITFECGGDSRLVVTKSTGGTSEDQTKASWRVGDVRAEVADLRRRGVEILEYDEPGLETADGVADVGFGLSAWFTDPSGNTISLLEFKDEGLR
jgi:catechol-2,3-dioxygenase